jgi:transcriptional regulator with XRE-family HTH domain
MRQKRKRTKGPPAGAAGKTRTPAYRHGTLGWLASSVAFKEGYDSAVAVLRDYLPASAYQDWNIVHEAQGFSTLRTEVTAASDITYLSYDPPDLWGPSYSVLRATFAPRRARSEFMSHSGEEALIPISGRIQYHFAWTPGGKAPEVHLSPVLEKGSAIRLTSQVPHHTWAVGQTEASAWMVFRPSSESPTAINVSARGGGGGGARQASVGKTGFTAPQVLNPVTYALLAWGIAEQTRLFRDRANIGVSTLAGLCHVDAAQISRIEAASQNVSVEAIARLARFLRFPLPQLIVQASQEWMVSGLPDGDREASQQPVWRPLLAPRGEVPHNLHLSVMRLSNGWTGRAPAYRTLGPSRAASWIVLDGSLEVQLRDASGAVTRAEVLRQGTVAHFRRVLPTHLVARPASAVLQVMTGAECTCGGSSD